MKISYSIISFLLRGERRLKILKYLNNSEQAKIPKKIAEDTKFSLSNVSNSLAELLSKNLIKCVNPQDKMFRFYIITNKGKESLKELENKKF